MHALRQAQRPSSESREIFVVNTLSITPVQWSSLHNIDAVAPINDGDADCLAEIRDVLKKHGKMNRLGVALLHSHFELATDEIMLESADDGSRTLVTRAVKQSEAGTHNVGTIWKLNDGDFAATSWCRKFCERGILGHSKSHNDVPGK